MDKLSGNSSSDLVICETRTDSPADQWVDGGAWQCLDSLQMEQEDDGNKREDSIKSANEDNRKNVEREEEGLTYEDDDFELEAEVFEDQNYGMSLMGLSRDDELEEVFRNQQTPDMSLMTTEEVSQNAEYENLKDDVSGKESDEIIEKVESTLCLDPEESGEFIDTQTKKDEGKGDSKISDENEDGEHVNEEKEVPDGELSEASSNAEKEKSKDDENPIKSPLTTIISIEEKNSIMSLERQTLDKNPLRENEIRATSREKENRPRVIHPDKTEQTECSRSSEEKTFELEDEEFSGRFPVQDSETDILKSDLDESGAEVHQMSGEVSSTTRGTSKIVDTTTIRTNEYKPIDSDEDCFTRERGSMMKDDHIVRSRAERVLKIAGEEDLQLKHLFSREVEYKVC